MSPPFHLASFDPGLRVAGLSYFVEGQLRSCFLLRNPVQNLRGPTAWVGMANAIPAYGGDVFVSEVPQVYSQDKANGVDPADLVELAGVVGAVTQKVGAVDSYGYLPKQWKGTVPKNVHNQRILDALSADERAVLEALKCPPSLLHNVIDSVGVGLFQLKRLSSYTTRAGKRR